MHPTIIQAVATERAADMQAHAAAARRAREIRRPGQAGAARHPGWLVRTLRLRPSPRPLRDPRAA
jgi:hypothetical protein